MSSTVKHLVELDGDENIQHFRDSRRKFKKIRVVVHTTGAWPNSPLSDNHVSVYLLLQGGGSVQINMRTDVNDTKGQLEWSAHTYDLSRSAIVYWDYELGESQEVGGFYSWIRKQELHRYQFSGGGSGCHFWVYTLLNKMATINMLHETVPDIIWGHFQWQYSRNAAPRPTSYPVGSFLNYDQWLEVWTAEDEDDEE